MAEHIRSIQFHVLNCYIYSAYIIPSSICSIYLYIISMSKNLYVVRLYMSSVIWQNPYEHIYIYMNYIVPYKRYIVLW